MINTNYSEDPFKENNLERDYLMNPSRSTKKSFHPLTRQLIKEMLTIAEEEPLYIDNRAFDLLIKKRI